MLRVIRELANQNTTMIIVTHEMAFAKDVANHVIFMDDGKILEQGDPEQVFEHPREERTRSSCPATQKIEHAAGELSGQIVPDPQKQKGFFHQKFLLGGGHLAVEADQIQLVFGQF